MDTKSPPEGANSRITINGAMTVYEAVENKRELLEALAMGEGLDIDVSQLEEIDTAGLQLLVLARREGARAGKPVRLIGRSAALLEVLERYGLQPSFDNPTAPSH